MRKYTWDKINDHDDESEFGILTPDRCCEITHEEAVDELNELLNALHDAIRAPEGVVPDSAKKFYQSVS